MPHNNAAVASHFAAKFFLSWLVCADVLRRLNNGSAAPPPSLFGFGLWGGKLSVAELALIAST